MNKARATEGNIVRLGWKNIGYRVSAQEMSKVKWFRWWVMVFAFIPVFSSMMYLVHILESFPSQQRLWLEMLGLVVGLAVFCVSTWLATWKFIQKLCKDKKPIDGGISVIERRRRHARNLYNKYRYGYAIFAALLAILYFDTESGFAIIVSFLFCSLALEMFYFQHIERRRDGETWGAGNTQ